MDVRGEFYRTLSEDLTLHGKRSVLYRHLEEEQEKRVLEGSRRDLEKTRSYQLRIRCYRRQLKNGEILPEEYLKLLFGVLLQKPQFSRRCGKPDKGIESGKRIGYVSEDPQPLLQQVTGALPDCGKLNFVQDMQTVYDILNKREGAEYEDFLAQLKKREFLKPPFTKLKELTDAVLDVAIAYDIREFFFDTIVERMDGSTVSKRKKASARIQNRSRAERTDKSLKLLDRYCRETGKTLFGSRMGAGGTTAPGDMECDALYRQLLREGNEQVLVPLLVDGVTGCGIYVVGKAYFMSNYRDAPKRYESIRESCAYGVLFLNDDYGYDIRMGYYIGNEFGAFPDYNSARFSGDMCYEQVRQEAEESIRETNGQMPDGVPKIFRNYFMEDTEQETEFYRQEILREVAECERELRS